ncbi:hypothetical protein CMUS01_11464 [Colletotrichum musicola]|uniref:Uncharacterized protein n=1 Tax=Colletotrichum musicola TaxID=2175873 RepID=A0A8H6JYB5_9PEZI|nr:hypothetical protein CMUS01_11464 [Colletotrichum musicola]
MGTVFTSKGKGEYHGVRFADVNGDGRTDWLWLNDQGQTSIYTNNRGCEKGTEGDGLKPLWREAENMKNGKGPTHPGVGVDGARANIHFARATGVVQDFGLHMVSDYIWIEDKAYGVDQHEYTFHVWKNLGRGGTKLKGEQQLHKDKPRCPLTLRL